LSSSHFCPIAHHLTSPLFILSLCHSPHHLISPSCHHLIFVLSLIILHHLPVILSFLSCPSSSYITFLSLSSSHFCPVPHHLTSPSCHPLIFVLSLIILHHLSVILSFLSCPSSSDITFLSSSHFCPALHHLTFTSFSSSHFVIFIIIRHHLPVILSFLSCPS
jgi:hypothetical protein